MLGFKVLLSHIVAVVYPGNWTPNCLSEHLKLGHFLSHSMAYAQPLVADCHGGVPGQLDDRLIR